MITKTYSFIKNGNQNDVYTLKNANGVEVDILTYGAHLIRISVPDKNGNFDDILVGCKKPEDYYEKHPHFGGTIGRFGNRIEKGKFTINGVDYQLEINDKSNCLHGGITAPFDKALWDAEIDGNSLIMRHTSPDMAGGFPGEMQVTVTFTLTNENELVIDYKATTDKDTLCNLTNHAYFNIGGQETVLGHELYINAKQMTDIDEELIPHGELVEIDGTPYSFNPPKLLGKDMFSDAKWIKHCNGFDFNYCLDRKGDGLEHCAYVYDKETGRRMDCYTTLEGIQLYTACGTGGFKGKKDYVNHCALCLETQGYPNSPNCPNFPSTVLKAGDTYHEITVYKFSVVK